MRGDDGEVITYVDERDVKFVPVPGLYLRLCLPSPRISAPVAFRPLLSCARNYASEATFRVQKALRAHHEPRALKEERMLFLVECLLTYKRDLPMPWQRIAFCGRLCLVLIRFRSLSCYCGVVVGQMQSDCQKGRRCSTEEGCVPESNATPLAVFILRAEAIKEIS